MQQANNIIMSSPSEARLARTVSFAPAVPPPENADLHDALLGSQDLRRKDSMISQADVVSDDDGSDSASDMAMVEEQAEPNSSGPPPRQGMKGSKSLAVLSGVRNETTVASLRHRSTTIDTLEEAYELSADKLESKLANLQVSG